MAENKTRETDASVAAFLDAIPDDGQRADAGTLAELMERLSGEPPRMWGTSIVGFGSYRYEYESGREGDSPRIGFFPAPGRTVLYIVNGFPAHSAIMVRLGRFKTGKSCLYIKKLADVDGIALEELIQASIAHMDEKYPH